MTDAKTLLQSAFDGTDLCGNRWADPWEPDAAFLNAKADVFVRFDLAKDQKGVLGTLQAAIDHVVNAAKADRRRYVISIGPGFFDGPIIVPKEAPPITICGAGAGETVIGAGIDAGMSGWEYANKFRDTILAAGPKSREAFARIVARQKISTGNSSVMRVCSDDFRLAGVTIRNDYACDRKSAAPEKAEPDAEGRFAEGQHQAVALMLDGADRAVIEDCSISSFQDTLYLKTKSRGCTRSAFYRCDIEGDVDFIFGGATAVFDNCTIRSRGERRANSWALAPSTSLLTRYGFIFNACRFVDDQRLATGRAFLGRQWFEGVRATPYGTPDSRGYTCKLSNHNSLVGVDGQISRHTLESVGKCVLMDCRLDAHLDPRCLWDDWASGAWTPRYRPVQSSQECFLEFLEGWLPPNILADYLKLEGTPWLSQIRSENAFAADEQT